MDNINEKINSIFNDLENGVRTIFESDKYKHYLEVMLKFRDYSANNWRLIYKQCPHATKVAGYRQWQNDFNRYVKKGEKAIRIIAPHKDYGFIEVCVFDISQTDGTPLPNDGIVIYQLNNDIKNYDILLKALKKVSPLEIYFEKLEGLNGICYLGEKIKINTGMSEAQTLETLIHEIAHAMLHNYSLASKETKEVEAESVAFAVCAYLGIDTSSFSFGYIAKYSRSQSTKILLESLDTITQTTKLLIQKIRKELGLVNEETSLDYNISQLLYERGLEYCAGTNGNINHDKAFQYFLDAALYGHKKAAYKVALCYENGIGTDKNFIEAIDWYMKIPNNKNAQYAIGYLIFLQKKDQQEAFKWFMLSARQGNRMGEYCVGLYYMYGYGKIKKDYLEAFKWFSKASRHGYSPAQYNLAKIYKYGYGKKINEAMAFKWFLKSAEQGHRNAQYEIAKCYETGRGTDINNSYSFDWLLKAANQGHRIAQYEIATHYFTGNVVPQNYVAAFIWYLDSAKQHYPKSQYMLGICYKNGYGIKASFKKSFEYFKLVSDTNKGYFCGASKYELANYYKEGLGVEKNLSKAYELYQEAIALGYDNTKYKIAPFYINGIPQEDHSGKGAETSSEVTQVKNTETKKDISNTFTNFDNFRNQKSQSFISKIKDYFYKFFGLKKQI